MKQDYEDALRLVLPRRLYVIVRIDGRGFHTFTKNLERPYSRLRAARPMGWIRRLCRFARK